MLLGKSCMTLCAALALTACGTTSTQPVKALPSSFVDTVMQAAFAETIAEECGSLRYNTAREDKVLSDLALKLVQAGYTERDLDYAARQLDRDPQFEQKAVQMIIDRDINVVSEASWCAAGRREKARGTAIGRYLI